MSELDDYKKMMKERLTQVCRVIAQISAGNYKEHLDLFTLATDEYSELFFGLDILLNDLIKTRRDLEQQQAYHRTRAEIWRRASMAYHSADEMLKNLLTVLFTSFQLDMIGYLVGDKDDENYRCLALQTLEPVDISCFYLPKNVIPSLTSKYSYYTFIAAPDSPLFSDEQPKELRESANIMHQLKIKSLMGVFTYDESSNASVGVVIGSRAKRQWNIHEEHTIASMTMICYTRTLQLKVQQELAAANMRLEEEVAVRTKELNALNNRLTNDLVYKEQVERKLRENMDLYRALVETIPDPIMVLGDNGFIKRINSASLKTFHTQNEKDIIGHYLGEFIPEYNQNSIKKYKMTELQVRRCDGTNCLCEVTITDMAFYEPNQNGASLCLFHDITERRHQENELTRIQSLESIGILAGGIAHDFNNILSGIAGNLYIAKEVYGREPQKALSLLDSAHHSIIKAKHLTAQLLTFSKGGDPIKSLLNIEDILKEASAFALAGSQVGCRMQIHGELWLVEADASQLTQVFTNLLLNAAQEMQQGVIDLTAETCLIAFPEESQENEQNLALKPGNYIHVEVADRGRGISDEVAPYVFHPFYTTKKNGTGLGLTITYSIVKHHGGIVYHSMRPGGGTIFHVYLPAKVKPQLPLTQPENEPVTAEIPKVDNKRILLMDDDEDILEMLKELITFIGYEPQLVKNGDEALAAYQLARESGKPFAAVVLDLTIVGGMGGKETIGQLKLIDPDVYAIVVSGYSNDPVLANYKEYGFKDLLTKPYTIDELKRVLKRALSKA